MPKDQNDTASMVSSRSNDVAVKVNAAYYQSRPAIPGNLYSGEYNNNCALELVNRQNIFVLAIFEMVSVPPGGELFF